MSALPDIRPGFLPPSPIDKRYRWTSRPSRAASLEAVRSGNAPCRAICLDGDAFDRDAGVHAGPITATERAGFHAERAAVGLGPYDD